MRTNYLSAGIRPRTHAAVTSYVLGRLKSRESAAALRNMEFRAAEIEAITDLMPEAQKIVKILKSRKTNVPRDAYFYLASLPPEMLVFIEVELPNPKALSKIRNYVQKWRPMRLALPFAELDALGVPRGPKFDKILEQLFELQLRGKARTPEDRTKALRNLAGIKDEPKKKEEKEKKKPKGKEVCRRSGDAKHSKEAKHPVAEDAPAAVPAAAAAKPHRAAQQAPGSGGARQAEGAASQKGARPIARRRVRAKDFAGMISTPVEHRLS